MRVLITGGGGFIGSHVADRLLGQGDDVLVLDNFATGRRDSLPSHPKLTVVDGSIADARTVERAFADFRPERVLHAAASYKDPDDWTGDVLTNVLGTVHVVRAARSVGVSRLVYLQTSLCYGVRPREQPITLGHPIEPEGSYAISKTAAEQYVRSSGIEHLSFRLANVYGPRNLSGPLPTFYDRLTKGKPCFVVDTRRDFIFVDDVGDVIVKALAGEGRPGIYHIATGSDASIKELFDAVVAALGIELDRPVEVRPRGFDDAFTILLDPSETNREFRWRARTPLAAGVRAAIDYYRAHGITATYTHLRSDEPRS